MTIPIYKPYLPKKALKKAHLALDSLWISSNGPYIQEAQDRLRELLGAKYLLLVNNGTSACALMFSALKRKYPNINKIICPNNTYVAGWNAALYEKNYKLYTVDCDLETWNYDLNKLDKMIAMHSDAAVLIIHNIGNVINVPELQRNYPNTIFIEDACEALFGKYENVYTGTKSFISAFSTFGNKTISSGQGGFCITSDKETYDYIKCLHGQGQSEKKFIHTECGNNFRITNIEASLLLGQLDVLDEILNKKQKVFDNYRNALKNREDVLMQKIDPNTDFSNWMFGIRIKNNPGYDIVETFFREKNIDIRPMFYDITSHKHLRNNPDIYINEVDNAKLLQKECIILPSFPELKKEEQKYIIDVLEEYLIRLRK